MGELLSLLGYILFILVLTLTITFEWFWYSIWITVRSFTWVLLMKFYSSKLGALWGSVTETPQLSTCGVNVWFISFKWYNICMSQQNPENSSPFLLSTLPPFTHLPTMGQACRCANIMLPILLPWDLWLGEGVSWRPKMQGWYLSFILCLEMTMSKQVARYTTGFSGSQVSVFGQPKQCLRRLHKSQNCNLVCGLFIWTSDIIDSISYCGFRWLWECSQHVLNDRYLFVMSWVIHNFLLLFKFLLHLLLLNFYFLGSLLEKSPLFYPVLHFLYLQLFSVIFPFLQNVWIAFGFYILRFSGRVLLVNPIV